MVNVSRVSKAIAAGIGAFAASIPVQAGTSSVNGWQQILIAIGVGVGTGFVTYRAPANRG